jgi:hypothetical protein
MELNPNKYTIPKYLVKATRKVVPIPLHYDKQARDWCTRFDYILVNRFYGIEIRLMRYANIYSLRLGSLTETKRIDIRKDRNEESVSAFMAMLDSRNKFVATLKNQSFSVVIRLIAWLFNESIMTIDYIGPKKTRIVYKEDADRFNPMVERICRRHNYSLTIQWHPIYKKKVQICEH